jgi:hypothetical protein
MGSVCRRASATTWTVAWTQGGRKVFEHGFPDQDTAERFRALKVADVAAGRVGIPTKSHEKPRTLDELFDECCPSPPRSPRSCARSTSS